MDETIPNLVKWQNSNLSCCIVTEKDGIKSTHVFSIGTFGPNHTWSRCKMEEGSIWHHEQVIPVSLNSDAPRHFYPICTPPTHSPGILPSLAPEELGFCTVCADTGEVFHCHKCVCIKVEFGVCLNRKIDTLFIFDRNSLEGWKYRQITAINITAEARVRDLFLFWDRDQRSRLT